MAIGPTHVCTLYPPTAKHYIHYPVVVPSSSMPTPDEPLGGPSLAKAAGLCCHFAEPAAAWSAVLNQSTGAQASTASHPGVPPVPQLTSAGLSSCGGPPEAKSTGGKQFTALYPTDTFTYASRPTAECCLAQSLPTNKSVNIYSWVTEQGHFRRSQSRLHHNSNALPQRDHPLATDDEQRGIPSFTLLCEEANGEGPLQVERGVFHCLHSWTKKSGTV